MESVERFRSLSFDRQLLSVIIAITVIFFILSQKFTVFLTLSEPLVIIGASLYIWIFVSKMNYTRRLIGILTIIIFLCFTLLKWIPFAQEIVHLVSYPFILFCLWEFTQIARRDTKLCILWLLIFPMFLSTFMAQFVSEEKQWFLLTLYPLTWIGMAFYADATSYKNTIKYLGITLTVLLGLLIVVTDVLSLGVFTELVNNKFFIELFGFQGALPLLHLSFTAILLPPIVVCSICYLIIIKRVPISKT